MTKLKNWYKRTKRRLKYKLVFVLGLQEEIELAIAMACSALANSPEYSNGSTHREEVYHE